MHRQSLTRPPGPGGNNIQPTSNRARYPTLLVEHRSEGWEQGEQTAGHLETHHGPAPSATLPHPVRRSPRRRRGEPSAKPSVRTSGGLCAEPGRPPCAPLRCLLPPFCWGDPHPLPPDGDGDRLPLDRWLPVFRPSSRCLGLSLGERRDGGSRRGTPPLQVTWFPTRTFRARTPRASHSFPFKSFLQVDTNLLLAVELWFWALAPHPNP